MLLTYRVQLDGTCEIVDGETFRSTWNSAMAQIEGGIQA